MLQPWYILLRKAVENLWRQKNWRNAAKDILLLLFGFLFLRGLGFACGALLLFGAALDLLSLLALLRGPVNFQSDDETFEFSRSQTLCLMFAMKLMKNWNTRMPCPPSGLPCCKRAWPKYGRMPRKREGRYFRSVCMGTNNS